MVILGGFEGGGVELTMVRDNILGFDLSQQCSSKCDTNFRAYFFYRFLTSGGRSGHRHFQSINQSISIISIFILLYQSIIALKYSIIAIQVYLKLNKII